ncbi:hypothetical protein [Brevibacillus reuszeri]|uniref:hypothetical protein n=1 Tax=Brevibacillus reuszeri TaxID=54915 RepID=UPI000CCC5014|nr:hypothetical protein [Brevibacillus reuszeri]
MLFSYVLVHNESENQEGSANFHFPYEAEGAIEADEFESVVEWMKGQWSHLSNTEWDWYCNPLGTRGRIWFHNQYDGMAVVFEVVSIEDRK